jgi:preprotein translocase subunit SecY
MSTRSAAVPPSKTGLGSSADLKHRLLFVLGALIVFRIGSFIPAPNIDPTALAILFDQQRGSILDLFNMFSGGALGRFSVFAIGIMPYISAAIIVQLLTHVEPRLKELRKEGEAGRRRITRYTRYATVVLAAFQALGVAIALESQQAGGMAVVIAPGWGFRVTTVATLVTGTVFLMWLGEQISERGIGNGISIIIFAGIVAGLPSAIAGTLELARTGELHVLLVLVLLAIAVAVTGFVVFVERGQRRITVNYARRQVGRQVYAAQSSHLPLKLNMAGVIPPIFASSIILFPATLGSWFGSAEGMTWLGDLSTTLSPGQPVYVLLYAAAIIFFSFFYTALVFDPGETAENLKKSGAFVPGIRPGRQTARYIDAVMTRLTVAGSMYLTAVALLPEFMILNWNVPFYFGGTSLLIIVVVTMDFMGQLQARMMSHQYDSLLRKANLTNTGRPKSSH